MANTWQLLTDKIPQSVDEAINILLDNRGVLSLSQRDLFQSPPHPDSFTASDFGLNPSDIKKAIDLIQDHKNQNHKIAVYGDYDVDGMCATAILWESLYQSYPLVFPHIPHREKEGYGLSIKGIDHCLGEGAKLIITVDNGIVAHDQISYARSRGCDIIVIDHHQPEKTLPRSNVLLHSQSTCATVLAWFFSKCFLSANPPNSLELTAIALICDIIPLLGINRSLVKFGLESLGQTKRPGLLALFQEAGILPGTIDTHKVGYVIGPRLNASGRLEHAIDSLRLLCTRDLSRALSLARKLGETNRTRQDLTQVAIEKALSSIKSQYGDNLPKLLIVHDPSFHPGILGLIAARVAETYYRPAIAISEGELVSKASARSVAGFDITSHIRSQKKYLTEVGGHAMAAGFSLETKHLSALSGMLVDTANNQIPPDLLKRVIKIDSILPLNLVTDLHFALKDFSPFGLGNPEPVFQASGLLVNDFRQVGRDNKHLKLTLTDKDTRISFPAIAFGMGDKAAGLSPNLPIDAVFTIIQDNFHGGLEFKIKDIKLG